MCDFTKSLKSIEILNKNKSNIHRFPQKGKSETGMYKHFQDQK